jgi:hypothetical protein
MIIDKSSDWTWYRKPGVKEIDLHFGRRDRWSKSYEEAMAEITRLVETELREAQREGRPEVIFIHGSRTSRPGKTTARSQVRGFMRSSAATPLIERTHCVQHNTIFLAKVRLVDRTRLAVLTRCSMVPLGKTASSGFSFSVGCGHNCSPTPSSRAQL